MIKALNASACLSEPFCIPTALSCFGNAFLVPVYSAAAGTTQLLLTVGCKLNENSSAALIIHENNLGSYM